MPTKVLSRCPWDDQKKYKEYKRQNKPSTSTLNIVGRQAVETPYHNGEHKPDGGISVIREPLKRVQQAQPGQESAQATERDRGGWLCQLRGAALGAKESTRRTEMAMPTDSATKGVSTVPADQGLGWRDTETCQAKSHD